MKSPHLISSSFKKNKTLLGIKTKNRIKEMDKVKKAITCFECLQTIESPVVLPCSHSICKYHLKSQKSTFICKECGVEHQIPMKTGFPKNQALEYILEAKIMTMVDSVIFAEKHVEAQERCDRLENLIKKAKCLSIDPNTNVRETVDGLRNRAHIKCEKLKLIVDEKTEDLLNLLKQYEQECNNQLKKNAKNQKEFQESLNKIETELRLWKSSLNELEFNENKWEAIVKDCSKSMENLNVKMNNFEKSILGVEGGFEFYEYKVEIFENYEILQE